jgi:secreted trypsin-like serine protease
VPVVPFQQAVVTAFTGGLLAFAPPPAEPPHSYEREPEQGSQQERERETAPASTITRPSRRHIYGGELVRADETEYDAVVAVLSGGALCAGTLVAPDVVVTAAHCVVDQSDVSNLRVVRGLTATLPLQEVQVVAFDPHPDFCEEGCPDDLRDFAWLRLAEPVNAKLPRFALSQAEWDDLVGKGRPVELVGYGEAETGNDGRKRKVTSAITGFLAGGRELWAGADGKDSCRGDSGGPAFVRDDDGNLVLIGVLSRGRDCGEGGIYGVPQSEACWLRDGTGVDMAPGCDACDCLRLDPGDDGRGCAVTTLERDAPNVWLFGVFLVFGVAALRRGNTRRAARADHSRP